MALDFGGGMFGENRGYMLFPHKKTRYVVISPPEFTTYYPDVDDVYVNYAYLNKSAAAGIVYATAAASLPDGTSIETIQILGNSTGAITWILRRVEQATNGTTTLAIGTSFGTTCHRVGAVVDNFKYKYIVYVALNAQDDRIYSVKLECRDTD